MRRRTLLISFVVLLVAAAAVTGGELYLRRHKTPERIPPYISSVVYYSDGKTPIARIGTAERTSMLSLPTGLVVNHVLAELAAAPAMAGTNWERLRDSGYSITTTLDSTAQNLLEQTADETITGSAMNGQPNNLQAAATVVEPGTGRVLAYFGGHNGMGADFAGYYLDARGIATGYGAHPPGGTFEVYALQAALQAGVSVTSMWDTVLPPSLSSSPSTKFVHDTGKCAHRAVTAAGHPACSLADATDASLNTAYFNLTRHLGAAAVVDAAQAAGIDDMWTAADPSSRKRIRLLADQGRDLVPSTFDARVGIGQYPVTVLDQATAMATYASGGRRAQTHFVKSVRRNQTVIYTETLATVPTPTGPAAAALTELTWILSQTKAGRLPGRDSATKTGAWPLTNGLSSNGHAWIVGYTSNLAMAVWIGNKGPEKPLLDSAGATVYGSGLPATIYRNFMTTAHDQLGLTSAHFPRPAAAKSP